MHESSFDAKLELILAKDQRYPRDAYLFVRDALDHTVKSLAKGDRDHPRNVSIHELLEGIRDHTVAQFGPMAMTVLEEWGIRQCGAFGDIVFNMIEVKWLAKTDQDRRADFDGGFDFWEAFRKPFLPIGKQVPDVPAPKAATV